MNTKVLENYRDEIANKTLTEHRTLLEKLSKFCKNPPTGVDEAFFREALLTLDEMSPDILKPVEQDDEKHSLLEAQINNSKKVIKAVIRTIELNRDDDLDFFDKVEAVAKCIDILRKNIPKTIATVLFGSLFFN